MLWLLPALAMLVGFGVSFLSLIAWVVLEHDAAGTPSRAGVPTSVREIISGQLS